MPAPYICIQNGVVVNTQMCNPTDLFDHLSIWVPMLQLFCNDQVTPIQIGCTYDGTNFYAQVQ